MYSTSNPKRVSFSFKDIRNNLHGRTVAFGISNNSEIKFQLFYKQECDISTPEDTFTTIYLYLESSNKEQVSIEYRLSIGSGKNVKTQEGQETFSIAKQMRNGALFNIKQDYLLDPKNGLITKHFVKQEYIEQLRICCEIKEIETISINDNNSSPERDLFTENLQALLEIDKYADVVLFVGGKELRVHKNILAARSEVFSAMFENDCEEKTQNRVEITDIQLDVCEELLRYIYTAKIESMDKLGVELLVVSDKYGLDELKDECESYLKENLSIETVADILLLADLHRAKLLKAKCIDFISDNAKKVQNTSGWKTLTTKADLTTDLFLKLADKHEQLLNPIQKKEYKNTIDNISISSLNSKRKLKKDFGKMFEDEKFCDAVFILKNGELRAHRNILVVRSKVFADIFEQGETDRVELPDVSVHVFKQLLRYIYTNCDYDKWGFELYDNYAANLLILSVKYQLCDLKAKSERELSQTLEINSVSRKLLLADKQNAFHLKEKCIEYITENCRQVTQTEEWKILTKTRPELGVELFEHIAAKQWS